MDVAGIGVQTITPTTGTAAQNPDPPPQRPSEDAAAERVTPPASPGTGTIVDKVV